MPRPVRRLMSVTDTGQRAFPDLAGLDARQLEARLLDYLDEVMDLPEPLRGRQLAVLPRPLQVLWLLDTLDYEVSQGSLLAFVLGATAERIDQTHQALHAIGAAHTANALELAREAARDVIDLAERDGEDGVVRQAEPEVPGLASILTDRYWLAAEEDRWGQRLEEFVIASRAELEA